MPESGLRAKAASTQLGAEDVPQADVAMVSKSGRDTPPELGFHHFPPIVPSNKELLSPFCNAGNEDQT